MKLSPLTLAVGLAALLALSCCSPVSPGSASHPLVVMSWNVLSLFDAVDDGTEYSGWSVARGQWSEARYRARLETLSQAILAARPEAAPGGPGPDILCLIEIEKKSVLDDLAAGPLAKAGYRYSAFARDPRAATGVGLLSRLPLSAAQAWGQSLGRKVERPILEARLALKQGELDIFVNHWKSKLGGGADTEGTRLEQADLLASLIARRLAEADPPAVIACGDFNENPDEYARVGGRYPTAFGAPRSTIHLGGRREVASAGAKGTSGATGAADATDPGTAAAGEVPLYSPWADAEGYSYVHSGIRERIDGFLLGPGLVDGLGLEYEAFEARSGGLVDGEGRPIAWSNATSTGWSDHLPILLTLGTTR